MVEGAIIHTIVFSLILGLAGIVLSDKFKIPGILFFFAMGIISGPEFAGILNPQSLGNGLSIMITVFVIIILFEGGFSLNINQIRSLKSVLIKEITLSVIVMAGVGFLSARYIAGLPWEISLIFASLVIVTGPTVIKPVIRHIAISNKVKNFLNAEAVLIDAVGAILAIVILEFVITRHEIILSIAGFAGSLVMGAISGIIFGFFTRYLICRTKIIPRASKSFFVLGFVFLGYITSEAFVKESGLLTVVIMGIILSTMNYRDKESILNFKEQITRIVISILFVLLSANFNIRHISLYLTEGLIVVFIIIIARFPVIFLSTGKEDFSVKEKFFIAWLGPRGIIALSVASIAAIKLKSSGIEKAYTLEILIFMLISVTVILQGLSAKWLAVKLKILLEGDMNIIILGVNNISLMVAEKWRNDKTTVLFVDSSRKNCRVAEQKGFACREGNALDRATYIGIEMDDFTSVLAASDNNEINVLFCNFIKDTFGIKNLYTVLNEKANEELSQIIHNENIKLAFGTRNSSDENLSWEGFLSRLKDLFSLKKETLKWFTITNKNFIKNNNLKTSLPEGLTIFIVLRNRTDRYIYHTSFELHLNDEICVMVSPENAEKIESLITADA